MSTRLAKPGDKWPSEFIYNDGSRNEACCIDHKNKNADPSIYQHRHCTKIFISVAKSRPANNPWAGNQTSWITVDWGSPLSVKYIFFFPLSNKIFITHSPPLLSIEAPRIYHWRCATQQMMISVSCFTPWSIWHSFIVIYQNLFKISILPSYHCVFAANIDHPLQQPVAKSPF